MARKKKERRDIPPTAKRMRRPNDENEDKDKDKDNTVELLNEGPSRRRRNKKRVEEFGPGTPPEINDGLTTDAEIEASKVGFCCAVCTCNADEVEERLPAGDDDNLVHRWFQSSEDGVYHRRCCHGEFSKDTRDLQTEYEKCTSFLYTKNVFLEPVTSPMVWVTNTELEAAYTTSLRQESQLYNEDGFEHPCSKLHTSEDYIHKILRPFHDLKQAIQLGKSPRRKDLVVVDAFAGVGTALVAIKRLGLPIKKVIHIEIDKVATHVAKRNHPDVEFVCEISKFDENLVDNPEAFCEKYGPVDIIVGGPPCVDFCRFNANAQGTDGQQGKYLPRFLEFIRKVEQYQKKKGHPLFFLVENVILKGENLAEVNRACQFDWDPIMLDAGYFSPAKRRRHFWTNIPLPDGLVCDQDIAEPESCLDETFVFPARIVHREINIKAPCMMASAGRIDDPNSMRMFVFKERPQNCPIEDGSEVMEDRYCGRPMKVKERERLMGYPEGYVELPVQELFTSLLQKGLALNLKTFADWRTELPEEFHCFAGNYHDFPGFGLNPHGCFIHEDGDFQQIALKLAPPLKHQREQLSFFKAESYAKHLIGLAFSVPVMEVLLKPLKDIYESRIFPEYQYRYAWEDGNDAVVVRSTAIVEPPRLDEVEDDTMAVAPAAPAAVKVDLKQEVSLEEEGNLPDSSDWNGFDI